MTVSKVEFRAAQHMEGYLDPTIREKRITGALKNIRAREVNYGDVFDTIAYQGASGAITASIIAHRLKKPLLLVRKPEDTKGHSPYMLEGPKVVRRYLIVDDFMSSGRTYEAIREAVKIDHPQAECIGMLEVTYADGSAPNKQYRFSVKHQTEIERADRVRLGTITAYDVEVLSENSPIPPTILYKPVCILKDGETFKFQFKEQKFLPKPLEPEVKPTFATFFSKSLESILSGVSTAPRYRTYTVGEEDRVDIFKSTPTVPFIYEQKTQTSPEAAVSAATEG